MNKFFDVLNEIPIEVEEFGEGITYSYIYSYISKIYLKKY